MVNVGAILIYYVVTRLVLEKNKSLALQEKNHQLTMQAVQYENLREKIDDARRAKHDVRHHILLMQEYLNAGDYGALKTYLDEYGMRLPDDSLVQFCENDAANAVLLYFAQQAKNEHIDYIVKTRIPKNAGIPDTDISVLLGNLIENAPAACKAERSGERIIRIQATAEGGALCITVDNTYTGTLSYTGDGGLRSTKHSGRGRGTQSVRSIVGQRGGVCRFEAKDGMFYASVYCRTHQQAISGAVGSV